MAYYTEQEIIEKLEYYTIEIENRIRQADNTRELINEIPCPVSLHHKETFQHLLVNRGHVELTGYTFEEMEENWEEYMKIVLPESVDSIYEFLPKFYQEKNQKKTITFAQYAKLYKENDYSPLITFSKPSGLSDGTYLWLYIIPRELSQSTEKIERIIKMDEFKLKHFKRFQMLTDREVEVLTLLARGLKNPKIAEKLFLSRSTVETHRKNLKKKLELKSYRDVMRYALAFDLVKF